MVCKAYKYCVDNIGLFGEQTGERCSPLPPFVRLMHKVSERCLFFYAKKPWREMPVTASYQSCFFDVFSQRKQKNHAPQKKGVIWVQGHALLCTIYVQSIGAVSMFFTQKSRGGKCPSRRVTGAANRA